MNAQMENVSRLSVVIPVLNAAATLPAAIAAVKEGAAEIVVADGGSEDGTQNIAETHGAAVVTATRGRGPQLAAGAAAATSDWFLFLHADTRLGVGWADEAGRHMADPANVRRAAVFRFALDDPSLAARRIERLVAWRTRALALPYGDQALLISRTLYDEIGGFRPLPLMEDVDIVRRLGRRRVARFTTPAVTSAARYRRDGWWARPARNLLCLVLYLSGLPPRHLLRIYR